MLALRLVLALTLATVVAAEIWAVGTRPLEVTPIAPPRAVAAADAGPDTAASAGRPIDLPILDRNHVLARPLFTETRRAWQPPPEPAPVVLPLIANAAPIQEPAPPAPRLVGIGVASGRERALLGDPGGYETVWVSEGETAWAWVVREIDGNSVTVENAENVVPLNLYPDSAGG
ncbi:hypothetical protein SAMN04488020_1088 [Palleronia marisminoris]|uniref:Type II secretion system protein GspC N-terminal domain-containing protein n=1 Tax=Palleronia marisminoris TaxID=315423 RepID=A0A1Y5T6U3_9RHOB|nr:hypothetical protein [Palleronia marisminoris]SFH20339.1 hypothetical protein SAMN04488020_1088 [Palleronia marisminoris]SLN56888.1 hypothetical protein PAM7066_02716 [Palleronia marisminoris]